ncbi:DUF1800 family protein [Variovorax sp. OV329]|uniref:DUF1800 domain-containing protein n=1 Tax=Variovorax sp. OV329 TaxID=1882825 RepID=UPI0008F07B0D|nr:DUF1800 domain-containing protein [Variovorax sp. OV329]SFM44331.1 Uncharacterized conserved protein, DUF1800 family [Variovorax sp. OV329]
MQTPMTPAAIALNRFGLGARADEPLMSGDGRRWVLEQFSRYEARVPGWEGEPDSASRVAGYARSIREVRAAPEGDRAAMRQALRQGNRDAYLASVGLRMASALDTPAPFVERMVHFWSNHFAVSVDKAAVAPLAGAFEAEAIRPHVLGRFQDMLLAVERHPAMLIYLDQVRSIGPGSLAATRAAQREGAQVRGLNENLAREILELHTVGVRSGYGQDDVSEMARALTGWTVSGIGRQVPDAEPGAFVFQPALHEPGARKVLGRHYAEGGEDQARAILVDLAGAPATARHVATRLARHVVADSPSPVLVDRLADAFTRSGGDLPMLYMALIESPESWAPQAAKFKTPWEWAVSAMRALGWRDAPPRQTIAMLNQLGQPVWRPGSPAGFDDFAASWAAPDALWRRVEFGQRLAVQQGDGVDARSLAAHVLPGSLGEASARAIARAESGPMALALLLAAPEFQRR